MNRRGAIKGEALRNKAQASMEWHFPGRTQYKELARRVLGWSELCWLSSRDYSCRIASVLTFEAFSRLYEVLIFEPQPSWKSNCFLQTSYGTAALASLLFQL